MECDGCGNKEARQLFRCREDEWCDKCSRLSLVNVPDVYFKQGEVYESLGGITFESKREKAAYLKAKGYAEAGDKVGGADPLDFKPCERKIDREKLRREVKDAVELSRARLKGYNR